MDLMTGLAAIRQALDITKELRSIDDRIVVAEFKLRISEIIDKLLDAKQALVDAQERETELRKAISDMEAAQNLKAKLKYTDGLLYEIDESGENVNEPFCNQCFVKEEKLFRLQYGPYLRGTHKCSNCNEIYGRREPSNTHDCLVRVRRSGEDFI